MYRCYGAHTIVEIVFTPTYDPNTMCPDVVMQIRSHSFNDTFKACINMHFSLSA